MPTIDDLRITFMAGQLGVPVASLQDLEFQFYTTYSAGGLAKTAGTNTFVGNQVVTGNLTASGTVQGAVLKSTGNLDINPATTAVAPTAGAAAALPATPTGYATVLLNGVSRQVAYY